MTPRTSTPSAVSVARHGPVAQALLGGNGPGLRRLGRRLMALLCAASSACLAPMASADELPEYRLKAAFVYNFMAFADWPADTASTLTLCIVGEDPFGKDVDALQGKAIGQRSIALQRKSAAESIKNCHAVFVATTAIDGLARTLDSVRARPVLTMADSPGAMRRGVMINMAVVQGKVTFEANLLAVRAAGLNLSSKLLRLATEVQQ